MWCQAWKICDTRLRKFVKPNFGILRGQAWKICEARLKNLCGHAGFEKMRPGFENLWGQALKNMRQAGFRKFVRPLRLDFENLWGHASKICETSLWFENWKPGFEKLKQDFENLRSQALKNRLIVLRLRRFVRPNFENLFGQASEICEARLWNIEARFRKSARPILANLWYQVLKICEAHAGQISLMCDARLRKFARLKA